MVQASIRFYGVDDLAVVGTLEDPQVLDDLLGGLVHQGNLKEVAHVVVVVVHATACASVFKDLGIVVVKLKRIADAFQPPAAQERFAHGETRVAVRASDIVIQTANATLRHSPQRSEMIIEHEIKSFEPRRQSVVPSPQPEVSDSFHIGGQLLPCRTAPHEVAIRQRSEIIFIAQVLF